MEYAEREFLFDFFRVWQTPFILSFSMEILYESCAREHIEVKK